MFLRLVDLLSLYWKINVNIGCFIERINLIEFLFFKIRKFFGRLVMCLNIFNNMCIS